MNTLLDIAGGIKSMSDVSSTFVTWSLTIIGASVLAIVSTSYIRPAHKKIRYAYLLFLPGWICLSISIYLGNMIARRLAASFFTNNHDVLFDIAKKMNSEFICQMNFFKIGLIFFLIWLIVYLLWWIMGDWEIKK